MSRLHTTTNANHSAETYHVAFACDKNYAKHIPPIIRSILRFAPTYTWTFHILHSGINDSSKKCIESTGATLDFIAVSTELFKDMRIPTSCAHLTLPTYFRFLLPSLLPTVDQVLYLDCDVTVLGSIHELMQTDITHHYAAAAGDGDSQTQRESLTHIGIETAGLYFNAGVMLINLENWRRDGISEQLFLNEKKLKGRCRFADQDVLNYTLHRKVYELESRFNTLATMHRKGLPQNSDSNVSILHYNGKRKPWDIERAHTFRKEYISSLNFSEHVRFLLARTLASILYIKIQKGAVQLQFLKLNILKTKIKQSRTKPCSYRHIQFLAFHIKIKTKV